MNRSKPCQRTNTVVSVWQIRGTRYKNFKNTTQQQELAAQDINGITPVCQITDPENRLANER
jgi:hypothetical protein